MADGLLTSLEGPTRRRKASALDGLDTRKINHMGRQLVIRLNLLLRTATIHEVRNDALQRTVSYLTDGANELLAEVAPVILQGDQDQIYLTDFRLRGDTTFYSSVKSVLRELKARGVGGLSIHQEVTREEVLSLLEVLQTIKRVDEDHREDGFLILNEALADKGVAAFTFNPFLELGAGSNLQQKQNRSRPTMALKTYAKVLVAMNRAEKEGGQLKPIDRLKLNKSVQALVDLCHDDELFFSGMASLKAEGDYAYFHPVHAAMLSIQIGKHLGLNRKQLMDLSLAALYYDLGRSRLAALTFDKPEVLSAAEWDEMRRHPLRSAREIFRTRVLNETAYKRLIVAFEHHLGAKSGGYPQRIKQPKPHLFSRIVAVADAYDALTTIRPHRDGYLPAEALRILLDETEARYDLAIVKLLVNILEVYPQGAPVLLSTGELAIVVQGRSEKELKDRPIVRVLTDTTGNSIRPEQTDLAEQGPEGLFRRSITRMLDPEDPRLQGLDRGVDFGAC